jgi:hypothetical protein
MSLFSNCAFVAMRLTVIKPSALGYCHLCAVMLDMIELALVLGQDPFTGVARITVNGSKLSMFSIVPNF